MGAYNFALPWFQHCLPWFPQNGTILNFKEIYLQLTETLKSLKKTIYSSTSKDPCHFPETVTPPKSTTQKHFKIDLTESRIQLTTKK